MRSTLVRFGLALACAIAASCSNSDSDDESDDPASCGGCECEQYCITLCKIVDEQCEGISVRACTEGCFELEPAICPTDTPVWFRSCDLLAYEARCYEKHGNGVGDCAFGAGVPPGLCVPSDESLQSTCELNQLCNVSTMVCEPCSERTCEGHCTREGECAECMEAVHCAPTQDCSENVCRERCNDEVPCASDRVCAAGNLCSDPLGSPCSLEYSGTCFGGDCVDENASLITVEPYCALLCLRDDCPQGYVCQGAHCRQP